MDSGPTAHRRTPADRGSEEAARGWCFHVRPGQPCQQNASRSRSAGHPPRATNCCNDSPPGKRKRWGAENHTQNRSGDFGPRRFVRPPLPFTAIDIDQLREVVDRDATGLANQFRRRQTSAHRARINGLKAPGGGDAPARLVGLTETKLRQRCLLATSESLRLDAFNMSVPDEDDRCHVITKRAASQTRGGPKG